MITEAEQREAYEWRYDVEVTLSSMGFFCGKYENEKGATLWLQLPPLYTPDGKPDMNTVFLFVERLRGEKVDAMYSHGKWHLRPWTVPKRFDKAFSDTDFYAAFSQWREAQ